MNSELIQKQNERYKKLIALRIELRKPFLKKISFEGRKMVYYNFETQEGIPEAESPAECWEYLEKFLAPLILEGFKLDFELFGNFHEHKEDVKAILEDLEAFINKANNLSASERKQALNSYGSPWPRSKEDIYEYYRIKNGNYYKLNKCSMTDGNPTAFVYAKYFLYYDFLKATLNEGLGKKNQNKPNTPANKDLGIQLNLDEDQFNSLLEGAKPFFESSQHKNLEKLLKGEHITNKLMFNNRQTKWVEVFRRLNYNGFVANNKTEVKNWLCSHFEFLDINHTVQPFNQETVYGLLSRGKGDINKSSNRIINLPWLPYKRHDKLKEEEEKEKLL